MAKSILPRVFILPSARFLIGALLIPFIAACAPQAESPSQPSEKPLAEYCPFIASPAVFSSPVTVTGTAKYEYRVEGNGVIPNGSSAFAFEPESGSNGDVFSVEIDSRTYSYTCGSTCTPDLVVAGIKGAINGAIVPNNLRATGTRILGVNHKSGGTSTIGTLAKMTNLGGAKPIRRAEVRVTDSTGALIQCAETDNSGAFSLNLPSDGGTYTVAVAARSSNAYNTAYIMNNPTDNEFYSISTTVTASGSPSVALVAPASSSSTLLGGAFNILDQIHNAQDYLRTETANCQSSFTGCTPFTVAPLVKVYWAKGISPGSYYGISGAISFYLNGERELYILGGLNGNATTQDMDHFDNSVVIHEYGHFIEDQYANPDSPGGSHNGDSIIDARLAWGEGWANFFQAAVTQKPYYRDTTGSVDCSTATSPTCTGASFDEYLDPTPSGTYKDKPDSSGGAGEGNFREFSVTRLLWDIVKNGGTSTFKEIWNAFNGSSGMKNVNDPFKSIGRLHKIQQASSSPIDWSTPRSTESQSGGLGVYATPLTIGGSCTSSSIAMSIYRSGSDDGSFAKSNHHRNNDFYSIYHPGGTLNVGVSWSGASVADLDLYVYREGYTYGTTSTMATFDNDESLLTSGNESVSASLSPGFYMINVMAYTGVYGSVGTFSTTYSLTVNSQPACPSN